MAPAGGDALNDLRFRRPIAYVPFASRPRGENTRSLARVASSSRRMPRSIRQNTVFARASFSPSVLRAAGIARPVATSDRRRRSAGSSSTLRSSPIPSRGSDLGTHTSPEISCRYRHAVRGRASRPKNAFRASHIITLTLPSDHNSASSAARRLHARCRCSAPRARRDGPAAGGATFESTGCFAQCLCAQSPRTDVAVPCGESLPRRDASLNLGLQLKSHSCDAAEKNTLLCGIE